MAYFDSNAAYAYDYMAQPSYAPERRERTPERLMGKVMSYVFTLSMCAQPVGQLLYGALFDCFSHAPYWVLLPSGLLVGLIGAASVPFFAALEETPPAPSQTQI